MSFTGDLEHLPIVDIVQLLHAARKSGNLVVRGKSESQLVFQEGRVVSTAHRKNGARLGGILRDSKLLDSDALAEARGGLGQGAVAGLLRKGLLNQEQALAILENLVRTNLVEMLSWQQGTFSLDVDSVPISDEFRLLADVTGQTVRFDTQGLLMDALRIFDEKARDGELEEENDLPEEEQAAERMSPVGGMVLSLEDLGLDGLDQLERKIPDVFMSLHDPTPIDPQRLRLQELAADLAPQQIDDLLNALKAPGQSAAERIAAAGGQTLLFYSDDTLVSHCLTTVCKGRGIPVFTTTDAADVEPILAQSLGKGLRPLLVIDGPEGGQGEFSPERLAQLRRQILNSYPQLAVIEWQTPAELSFSLRAYQDGVRGVFPRPSRGSASFVPDLLLLLQSFLVFLQGGAGATTGDHLHKLQSSARELLYLAEIPEIADVLMQFVASFCQRTIVFVATAPGLVAGRSSGVTPEENEAELLRLRIPLDETSSLRQVMEEGRVVLASNGDGLLRRYLYPLIGAPAASAVLLLPLLCRGKKIALIYGDFGQQSLAPVPLELLEVLVSQAALQMEVALYRKKLEKQSAA